MSEEQKPVQAAPPPAPAAAEGGSAPAAPAAPAAPSHRSEGGAPPRREGGHSHSGPRREGGPGGDAAKAVPEVPVEVQAARAAASDSISAKRKSASSASRKWTSSTTSVPTFFPSSCRSAARFSRAA